MPKSFLIKKAVNGKQESSQVDGCFETEKIDQSGYDNIEPQQEVKGTQDVTLSTPDNLEHDCITKPVGKSKRKRRNSLQATTQKSSDDESGRPAKIPKNTSPKSLPPSPEEGTLLIRKEDSELPEKPMLFTGATADFADALEQNETSTIASEETPVSWNTPRGSHISISYEQKPSSEQTPNSVMVTSCRPRLSISLSPSQSTSPPSPCSPVSPFQASSPVPMCLPYHPSQYGRFRYPCHCCSFQVPYYQRLYYHHHLPFPKSAADAPRNPRGFSPEHDSYSYHQVTHPEDRVSSNIAERPKASTTVQIHIPKRMGQQKPVLSEIMKIKENTKRSKRNLVDSEILRKEPVRILPRKEETNEFPSDDARKDEEIIGKEMDGDSSDTPAEESLTKIKMTVGKGRKFTCKFCGKIYDSLGALKMHIRTHTLPCKCNICGKAFSRPWLLQGHIRTHTGEKPYKCNLCQRAFADRSNLRAHLQTHSDVKKYSCPTCRKTFSRMSLLVKHEEAGCLVS